MSTEVRLTSYTNGHLPSNHSNCDMALPPFSHFCLLRNHNKRKTEIEIEKKKGNEIDFKYMGSYEFGGRTIYVVRYEQAEIHIADGCWQIVRLVYNLSDKELGYLKMYFEFQEYYRDVFLPVSGFIKFDIKGNERVNGAGMISYSYNYL